MLKGMVGYINNKGMLGLNNKDMVCTQSSGSNFA